MARSEGFSPNTQTFTSPYLHAPNHEALGADSGYQHSFVKWALDRYFNDPFEKNMDLREACFQVKVHDDGLHVTISHCVED